MRGPQGRAFKIHLSLFGAAGFRNGCENPSRVLFITRHTTFCLSRLRAIFAAGNEIARMGPRGVPACPSLVPFLDKQERNSGRAKGARTPGARRAQSPVCPSLVTFLDKQESHPAEQFRVREGRKKDFKLRRDRV